MLLSSLGTSVTNVALPALAEAFSASFQATQWVVIAYLLAITTLIVSVGRLSDQVGRRRLLLVGLWVFTLASVLCGVAPSLGVLIVGRAVQGLGAAIMMTLSMAMVGEIMPRSQLGSAMGLLATMSAAGTALGPSLGGILMAAFGWRAIYFINVPLGFLALVAAYRFLPADQLTTKASPHNFDRAGTLLLALSLAAYALAMTVGRGSFGNFNVILLSVAGLGLAMLLVVEARTTSPVIDLAMFRGRSLSSGLAASACVSTVMMSTLVVGPFYLTRALGLDSALTGLVLSVGPLMVALTGVPAGRLSDRFGASRMTIMGLLLIVVGTLLMSVAPLSFGIPGFVAPTVIMTTGYALFQTANNTAVMSVIASEQRGLVSGMLNLSRNLGLITGASVMGAVFALGSGLTDIASARPESVSAGLRITFTVATAVIVLALVVAAGSRTHELLQSNQSKPPTE
jgi:EmrB/QacA subfamily drug resistance transporter